jgi:hypothetical protein
MVYISNSERVPAGLWAIIIKHWQCHLRHGGQRRQRDDTASGSDSDNNSGNDNFNVMVEEMRIIVSATRYTKANQRLGM